MSKSKEDHKSYNAASIKDILNNTNITGNNPPQQGVDSLRKAHETSYEWSLPPNVPTLPPKRGGSIVP